MLDSNTTHPAMTVNNFLTSVETLKEVLKGIEEFLPEIHELGKLDCSKSFTPINYDDLRVESDHMLRAKDKMLQAVSDLKDHLLAIKGELDLRERNSPYRAEGDSLDPCRGEYLTRLCNELIFRLDEATMVMIRLPAKMDAADIIFKR